MPTHTKRQEVVTLNPNRLFLAGLSLVAVLWTGCSSSDISPVAEAGFADTVVEASDELRPEESALVDSAEAEGELASSLALQETP